MKSPSVNLAELFPEGFDELLVSKGTTFIRRAGNETLRQNIIEVLCGSNIRSSTEHLTRLRLGKINAATFIIYLRGLKEAEDFSRQIALMAFDALARKRGIGQKKPTLSEKSLFKWMIGLTGKSVQNVLRDDDVHLKKYIESFAKNLKQLALETEKECGKLECRVKLSKGGDVTLDWHDLLSLFCTIGSQTLAIRGSDKSTYGKLFERLVLGSVLTALGFEQTTYPPKKSEKVFWLSSRIGERETDATLLVSPGQAVSFDLGFIGRGNPEITKDKVSRFERDMEINEHKFSCATCIIVDRIGEGSSLQKHAGRIGAKIIQMSISYWPKELAQWLSTRFGHKSDVLNCPPANLAALLQSKLATASFENFVSGLTISEVSSE